MTWALHFANILILCSFLVRDILVLRLLSIGAGVFFSMYFFHEDMIEPIVWNVLFSAVNIVQITRLWFKRRKISLRVEEQFLKDRFFSSLHPSEIRELVQCGDIRKMVQGEPLSTSKLSVIINGQVLLNEQCQFCGQFIGIKCFLSQKTSADSFNAKTNVVCIEWDCHAQEMVFLFSRTT